MKKRRLSGIWRVRNIFFVACVLLLPSLNVQALQEEGINEPQSEQARYNNAGGFSLFETGMPSTGVLSLDWGDADADGDMDLAVGRDGQPPQVYIGTPDGLALNTFWQPPAAVTRAIQWGDVDEDGDLDLALGNQGQPNQLYLNDGHCNFTLDSRWQPDPMTTQSLAWADVDMDGDLDLAVGNRGQPNQLYRNDGLGILTVDLNWSPPAANTSALVWQDIEGDGDPDLTVGNDGQPNQIYLNDPQGGLTLDLRWAPATAATTSLLWLDVDGDSDPDLVVGNFEESNQLYWNDGQGMLALNTSWNPPAASTTSLSSGWISQDPGWCSESTLCDFNALFVGNLNHPNAVYAIDPSTGPAWFTLWYQNSSSGHTHALDWAGIGADGGDVLRLFGLYYENGAWEPDQWGYLPAKLWDGLYKQTTDLDLGDADGDGDLDLAVATMNQHGWFGDTNQVYENDGRGTFRFNEGWNFIDIPPHPDSIGYRAIDSASIAWGDLDLDSDLDLVVGNIGIRLPEPAEIFRNRGDGMLIRDLRWAPPLGATPTVALGDIDADGSLDLFTAGCSSYLYRNDGQGNFVSEQQALWDSLGCLDNPVWGDMDGDGDLDLAVETQQGDLSGIQFLQNDGSGTLTLGPYLATGAISSLTWGDADNDGDLDLAIAAGSYVDSTLYIYFNNGQGEWGKPVIVADSGPFISSLAWGDVNRDGFLDLLIGRSNAPNQVYLNYGWGNFKLDAAWNPEAHETTSLAAGDLDSDGDLDLIVGNLDGYNQIYFNNGNWPESLYRSHLPVIGK